MVTFTRQAGPVSKGNGKFKSGALFAVTPVYKEYYNINALYCIDLWALVPDMWTFAWKKTIYRNKAGQW